LRDHRLGLQFALPQHQERNETGCLADPGNFGDDGDSLRLGALFHARRRSQRSDE
jgi:hypothetical protein